MAETEDLYEILQLHPSAHQDVIDAAYQRLASIYHPAADPSPETAEKLAAVSQAYAVLGDTEKRAAYDQSREAPRNVPSAEAAGETPETVTPKPRPRRRTKQSDLEYITIGSSKEDVARIQGPPGKTGSDADYGREGEWWSYGLSDSGGVIRFNKASRVQGWLNRGGLIVRMVPGPNVTTSELFSIDSHKDDVVRVQGTPYNVYVEHNYEYDGNDDLKRVKPRREVWHFPGGFVEFSISTGRVTAWDNQDGSINAQQRWPDNDPEWTGRDFFTLGSTKRNVKRVQGQPTSKIKDPIGTETWHYGNDLLSSRVVFRGDKVEGWNNSRRDLKVRLVPGPTVSSRAAMFSIGFHKHDVARLQGTPRSISALKDPTAIRYGTGYELWHFNGGSVTFSTLGSVTDWNNPESVLKVRGIRPDPKVAEKFRATVPKAQGCTTVVAVAGLVVAGVVAASFLA